MNRKKAHCEEKEPLLEGILSTLRFNKIIEHIPQNSKILDLGCGYNANFIRKISNKNCHCFGLDISINKELHLNNTTLAEHNLNNKLPFDDNIFDVVISLANLEHLQDLKFAFKEIFRVLKPGGILLLTTPSIYAKPVLEFLSFKLHLVSENEIRDHKNYFNKKILSDMCREVGFSQIRHKYFQIFMNNFLYAKK